MTHEIGKLRCVLAGYGMPAEYALNELFGSGVEPDQVLLLSQASDARNAGLVEQAQLRGIKIVTEPASRQSTIDKVRDHQPDIVLSIHYRSRIPGAILSAARLGTINLHPSLLPRYRGTNSVAWVIANGETKTGFSYHSMTEEFDAGVIYLQEEITIEPWDTAFSLFHRQITAALPRLGQVIRMVAARSAGAVQVGEPSYYPRGVPHDGLIAHDWEEARVERFIRAMHFPPFEPARIEIDGTSHPVPDMQAYRNLMKRLSPA